jgi:hypothetical protein
MSTCKETVVMDGFLHGEGRKRACRVKAVRNSTFPDESASPISIAYCRCEIEDTDEFPNGEYQLEFDNHKVLLIKRDGQYLTRL